MEKDKTEVVEETINEEPITDVEQDCEGFDEKERGE